MDSTGTSASPDSSALRTCLILIAVAYAAFGAFLVFLGSSAPLTVVGRVLVVGLLCLQVYRGHNWARLLLGAFTALITVVFLLTSNSSILASLDGMILAGLVLLLGAAYVALFTHPRISQQFAAARARRTPSRAAL
jgi:hypothetical protein